jgi:succinate dehydrogenase/fumarate reductase flavoprotein subunit
MYPDGGGLEFCSRLGRALEDEGVQILNRIFITGLMKGGGDRVIGAVGIHSRTGEFHVIRARATIVATNAITFRSGFVRDITGTGTLLAYKAGAAMRNAEFSYTRPSTPRYYFEGIAFAIQDGARFVNEKGEQFMKRYDPVRGDRADVPVIARAMAMEHQAGNAPVYLDMSGIPEEKRHFYIHSNVGWMEHFYTKLSDEARTDMFGRVPYYPLNQMTKMAIRTDIGCRSDVPGLLAAGLAQAGCANHFAGFHIGVCIGTGWIAGESALADLDSFPIAKLDAAEVADLRAEATAPLRDGADAATDRLLTRLQQLMFAYDVSVWKRADRLEAALAKLAGIQDGFAALAAPHTHELVRLKETEAMLLAAEIILRTSLARTESRLSHFREDHDIRDDANWLAWIDVTEKDGRPVLAKTPIPTPIHPVPAP